MASHQLAKFGGHRHCSGGHIMISDCHVSSQNLVIKVSYDFLGRSPSSYHPGKFGGHRHANSGYSSFKWSRDLARRRD